MRKLLTLALLAGTISVHGQTTNDMLAAKTEKVDTKFGTVTVRKIQPNSYYFGRVVGFERFNWDGLSLCRIDVTLYKDTLGYRNGTSLRDDITDLDELEKNITSRLGYRTRRGIPNRFPTVWLTCKVTRSGKLKRIKVTRSGGKSFDKSAKRGLRGVDGIKLRREKGKNQPTYLIVEMDYTDASEERTTEDREVTTNEIRIESDSTSAR